MIKKVSSLIAVLLLMMTVSIGQAAAGDEVEIAGVKFPTTVQVDGKTLTLNGVTTRRALGFIDVYAAALYLEKPTSNPQELVESEQVKYLITHYLTNKATSKRLSEGFIDVTRECNPPDLFQSHLPEVELYASWLNKDMKTGMRSISTYVPGKGLSLLYQGEPRGTIADPVFAQMYYRNCVGEKADSRVREGLLGKH